jgi:deoxyadenosine/deoxycytidine kinase
VIQIQKSNRRIIQDRTIYEDAYIFAMNLYKSGIMSANDYTTYRGIFDLMMKSVKAPDLTIYLKADLPKLVSQIKKRGRDFESNITEKYLSDLNEHYQEFTTNYKEGKILVLDVNNIDFVNNPADLALIISKVDKALLYEKPPEIDFSKE